MLYFLYMKKTRIFTFAAIAVLFTIIFSACATKQEEPQQEPDSPEVIETPQTEEPVIEEVSEDVIVIEDEGDGSDDEYLLSIANLDETQAVTKQ